MKFEDQFSKQAALYKRYRPGYPNELFEFLNSQCASHQLAWDCATGNGQAANSLIKYFERVIATDASLAQLQQANQNKRIDFRNETAEKNSLTNTSCDLITVATAAHWFNLPAFYNEVKRVIKPHGVLALWKYNWCAINDELDSLMMKLGLEILDSSWRAGANQNMKEYDELFFPFTKIETPQFYCTANWKLEDAFGWMNTWSATQNYLNEHGKNPIDFIRDEYSMQWGNAETVRPVKWKLSLLLTKF